MTPTDSMLQNSLLAFAAIYIALALVRLVLHWKNIKAIIETNAAQKQRAEQSAASNQEKLSRLEALQRDRQKELIRSEELWRQSEETQKRSAAILSRLEALVEKFERRNDA